MPKTLLFFFAFLPATIVAQTSSPDTTAKPYTTPLGRPLGNLATATMDSKGGIIKSGDGTLELIFPPGALSTETAISIQSIHNELTEDDEGAYQLEPSGLIFKKPVQLVFHYTGGNSMAEFKGVGWQDTRGQWRQLQKTTIDTVNKTISAFAPHFSVWASFNQIYLSPKSASVKVNKTAKLTIKVYKKQTQGDDDGDLLAPPGPVPASNDPIFSPFENGLYYSGEWTANGIVNGNGETGLVTKQNNENAMYKAPPLVPDGNPVAVSVQIYSNNASKKLLLTTNVTVTGDQYHFTYIHIDEGDGCFALVDSSSCIINMEGKKASVSNIINYRPWSDWPNCDKCRWEWTNKETVKGMVEINGMASSLITPPSTADGVTNVYITLVPAMGSTPSAIAHCKGGDRTIPSMPRPADPKYINFDIDRDNLVIHFGGKTGTNELVVQGHNEKTMIYMYKLN